MSACRKRLFATEEAANAWGWAWAQRGYRCPACAGWHLTKRAQGPGDEERAELALTVSAREARLQEAARHNQEARRRWDRDRRAAQRRRRSSGRTPTRG